MPLDYNALMKLELPQIEQQVEARDVMLYALGVGLGADPLDARQLRFVYEDGLHALPTMSLVLCYTSTLETYAALGATMTHVLHGEQSFSIARPLPVKGTLIGRGRVVNVLDKGADKGAIIFSETTIRDKASNELVSTLNSTTFCRADGGFGGPTGPTPAPHPLPTRAPDIVCDLPTLPQAALIYRLSGDYNPLHADPAFARAGGFDRPILHGRCTFGVAGHAILKTCCDYDPARLVQMQGRFSAPVYPGETIRTEIWRSGEEISYRASVPARGVMVMNNGKARVIG